MDTKANTAGGVLVVSYNNPKFIEIARKYQNAFILDAREKGKSQNDATTSENLRAACGKRYVLKKELAVTKKDSPESYIEKSAPVIENIITAAKDGYNIIITAPSNALLKVIGQFIIAKDNSTKVFAQWNEEEEDQVPQFLESAEKTAERLKKLFEKKGLKQGRDANKAEGLF